jgi:uncharacterized Tic20 family protein
MSQPPLSAPNTGLLSGPTDSDDRALAMMLWLIDFLLPLIGPFVLWWLKRKESPFTDHHGKACLNHTFAVLVLILIACALLGPLGAYSLYWADAPWTVIGIVVVLLLWLVGLAVFSTVIHLIAAFKALAGVWYVPPLCWRFVK